ncbi:MAG TPA: YwbE family protein [Bacteroidetes bacterium]|nr:YwbE family protein [Bacteroidota bacterium]
MNGTQRADIHTGQLVLIIQKHHQRTGELTEGFVQRILTSSPKHSRGIKVRLQTGEVGRVQEIVEEE